MCASFPSRRRILAAGLLAVSGSGCGWVGPGARSATRLLNASFDPTRELFDEVNRRFAEHWADRGKGAIAIDQSHGGSGKQARSVIDGLRADVVTLGLAYDIDSIASRSRLLPANWQRRLPYNSCPYASTVVFLVRKGNPRKVRDWDDLTLPGVAVVTPNPKISGGARWNYLAAWAYASRRLGENERRVGEFVARIYANAPVLDSGARAATTTFVQREIGDVLICWESEGMMAMHKFPAKGFEIVYPSVSVHAETPVAVVTEVARRNGNEFAAVDYLEFLYRQEIQTLGAKQHLRPSDPAILERNRERFPAIQQASIDEDFGGWPAAHRKHFADGGMFDRIQLAGEGSRT